MQQKRIDMTIDIKLIGWSAKGFRCPDHQVELINENDEPYHVTLIQMPNGTGKTTTLELLRLALSGAASNQPTQYIRSFAKEEDAVAPGVMEVRLLVDKKVVTFVMTFDYLQGKASYKTTYRSGQNSGFLAPMEVKKFLNPDFINYLILDGELAEKLLNNQQAAAQDVIDALFQVDSLKKIGNRVDEYWAQATAGVTTRTEKGQNRQENLVDKIKARLNVLEQEYARIDLRIQKLSTELAAQKSEHQAAIENNRAQNSGLLNAQESLHQLEKEQISKTATLLDLCASPQNLSGVFATSILNLKLGLDRVKLPEAAAKEFFEELCDEPECICGREINPEIANTIRAKASQYLGSDDVSLLNSLKTAIDEAVGQDPEEHRLALNDQVKELTEKVRAVNEARTLVEELTKKASEVDPRVKQAQDEIERLTRELKEAELDRAKYESQENPSQIDGIYGLDVLRSRLAEAEQYLAEITGTMAIKQKTAIIKSILDEAYNSATKQISTELVEETNNNLKKWLPNNNLKVESIHGHLRLKGKSTGSAGENLSVAYGFLSTLFNRTTHSLPFIVDSPAGALDNAVRKSIGKTIPQLTTQFVTFIISSERLKFIDEGIEKATNNIQYITIFRKRISDYLISAQKYEHTTISDDGVMVDSKEFFEHFDLTTD
jgi:DNA sulfur modification protein DndD